jgi:carboxylesterase type B
MSFPARLVQLLYSSCAYAAGIQHTVNARPEVSLSVGTFSGLSSVVNGTDRWLGIPYAQAPVGDLRFRAPVSISQPVSGVQDASAFGNACPQPASNLGASISEDCLFLNVRRDLSFSNFPIALHQVWRPINTKSSAELPVLLWIHVCALALITSSCHSRHYDQGGAYTIGLD